MELEIRGNGLSKLPTFKKIHSLDDRGVAVINHNFKELQMAMKSLEDMVRLKEREG